MNVDVGAAQGSVLGPFMYILYVNHLVGASKVSKFYLHTDNTNVTVSSTNLASAIDTLIVELRVVVEWFEYNHLGAHSPNLRTVRFFFRM